MTLLRLTVQTGGPGCHDITDRIAGWLGEIAAAEGVVTVFLRHTSASLLIQENAAREVQDDLLAFFARIAPESRDYAHDDEGPDDMPAHLRAALTQTQLSIPIADGRMVLGTWQGNGRGDYPTIEPYQYGQELVFQQDGRPFFHYFARSWVLDEATQLGVEIASSASPMPSTGSRSAASASKQPARSQRIACWCTAAQGGRSLGMARQTMPLRTT